MPLQQLQFKTSVFTGTRRQAVAGESLAKLITGGIAGVSKVMNQVKSADEAQDVLIYNDQLVKRKQAESDGDYGSLNWTDKANFDEKWSQDNQIEYSSHKYKQQNEMLNIDREIASDKLLDAENRSEAAAYSKGLSTVDAYNPTSALTTIRQLDPSFKTETFFNDRVNVTMNEIAEDRNKVFSLMSGSQLESHFNLEYIKDKKIKKPFTDYVNKRYVSDIVRTKNYSDSTQLVALSSKLGLSLQDTDKAVKEEAKNQLALSARTGDKNAIKSSLDLAKDLHLSTEVFTTNAKAFLSNPTVEGWSTYIYARDDHQYPDKTDLQLKAISTIATARGLDLSTKEGIKIAVDTLNANKGIDVKITSKDFEEESTSGINWNNEKVKFMRTKVKETSLFSKDKDQAFKIAEKLWDSQKISQSGLGNEDLPVRKFGINSQEELDTVAQYIYRVPEGTDGTPVISHLGNDVYAAHYTDSRGQETNKTYSANEFKQLVLDSKEMNSAKKILDGIVKKDTTFLTEIERRDAEIISRNIDTSTESLEIENPELFKRLSKKDTSIVKQLVAESFKNEVASFNVIEDALVPTLETIIDATTDIKDAAREAFSYLKRGGKSRTGQIDTSKLRGRKLVLARERNHLIKREGYSTKVYVDTTGHATAGIGHKMSESEKIKYPSGSEVPEDVIESWYEADTKKARIAAKKQSAQMKKTNQEVKEALVSVNFQLGTSWTTKFPTAWKHMKVGNIDRAISEIKHTAEGSRTKSNWNKQTPVRVLDFVNALETLN